MAEAAGTSGGGPLRTYISGGLNEDLDHFVLVSELVSLRGVRGGERQWERGGRGREEKVKTDVGNGGE